MLEYMVPLINHIMITENGLRKSISLSSQNRLTSNSIKRSQRLPSIEKKTDANFIRNVRLKVPVFIAYRKLKRFLYSNK